MKSTRNSGRMKTMNEILKVDEDTQMVSARELHERLNIKTKFATWFERMLEYGFSEGEDYSICYPNLGSEKQGGQNKTDYKISLDMAKHICMIQRTDEGKEIRQYLIDLEKAWNTPEQIMARALKVAEETIANLTIQAQEMSNRIEAMQPKVTYLDTILATTDAMLVTQIAQDYGMSARKFNAMLHDMGIQYKAGDQWILYSPYQGNGYIKSHTYTFDRNDGSKGSRINTEWTQKGRLFLYDALKGEGIVPTMEKVNE